MPNEAPTFNRPHGPPDLRVRLTMLSTSEGGRDKPLWQGCRMPHDFGLPEELNDGLYEFVPRPPAPGESAVGNLWLLAPERNAGRLSPGFEFRAWAEGKFFANCVVLEVVNEALRAPS